MRHHPLLFPMALVLCCGSACAPDDGAASQEDDLQSVRTQYVDIAQFLDGDAYERWFAQRRALERGFDDICGDTFCGGDFSNLESLGVSCSVSSKIGRVRECFWSFAGSQEQIDAASGRVASEVAFFECRLSPGGNASQLVAALGDDPLHAQLPGLGGSIYDALGDCLRHPVQRGALPEPSEGSFVDAQDALRGDAYEAYFEATYALRRSFEQECGDTFCEGEFSNYRPLRVLCSQGDDGQLGHCAWVFAANEVELKSGGQHRARHAPFVCELPVQGSAADFAARFAPSGEGRLLERTLPGSEQSLLEVLNRCL